MANRYIIFHFVLFCLITLCHTVKGNVFPTMNSFYSAKEICHIKLNRNNTNVTEGFDQSICKNEDKLIDNTHRNFHAESKILLPKQCHVGTARHNIGIHALIGKVNTNRNTETCRHRHIWERPYNKVINETDVHDYIGLFIMKLVSSKYMILKSYGDSITAQTNHFLSCDLLRYGYSLSACGKAPMLHLNKPYGCDVLNINNKRMAIEAQSFLLPCIYNSCMDVNATVSSYLHTLSRAWYTHDRPTIIVFNFGLHIHHAKNPELIIEIMARMLIKLSKECHENGDLLVFRETSAQHYFNKINGEFKNAPKVRNDKIDMIKSKTNTSNSKSQEAIEDQYPFCCDMPQLELNTGTHLYSSDIALLRHLNRIEPHWRKTLKWIPFFDISNEMFDMHFESGDCTHYVYGSKSYGMLARSLLSIFE